MKTTLYTVLCVAVRLSAVLMALHIVEGLPAVFVNYSPGPDTDFFWLGLGLDFSGLLLALALWLWPNLLVWWAIGRSQHQVLESSITASQLQEIALSVVGVWVFVAGLSAFLGRAVVVLLIRHQAGSDSLYAMTVPASQWGALVEDALTMILGALLALGSGALVGLFRRLRDYPHGAGTATDDNASHTQDS